MVTDDGWQRRKARQLFKCLLSRPRHRVSSDLIAEWIWPDSDRDAVEGTIRGGVHALRSTLRAAGFSRDIDILLVTRDGIGLNPAVPIWIDAGAFEQLIKAAAASNHPLPLLEEANALYLGDFLPDDVYEDWAADRREMLKQTWVKLQFQLAQYRDQHGDPDGAGAALRRLIDADPCDERAAQELMRLLQRQGRRAEASRVYRRLTQALLDELDVEPSEVSTALGHEPSLAHASGPVNGTTLRTFLLTDIESSVSLWELNADAMHQALIRHDALLDECVIRHAGTVVPQHGEGDSRFAVFGRASDAVAAACDLQRAFLREPWPTSVPMRIRIALHTGEAVERSGAFYGSAVNRCARLRGLAHGSQALLCEVTAVLVRESLPVGADLRDLAEHPLRGFAQRERVFQLAHPELPTNFPPLSRASRHEHNVPAPATPLIGRDQEVHQVCDLLRRDDVRRVTLTGAGGVGKTSLGLRVAADLLDHFSGAVCFIPLASISEPALLVPTIVQALGIRETGGPPTRDTLNAFLKEKYLLLLLDNFEQILSAGSLVSDLLASCPKLRVLVTSRAALQLRGEQEMLVPPLACPDPHQPSSVAAFSQYAAVSLFVRRAAAVRSDFSLTAGNAADVAEICRRVDGLPLGIELAAARVRLLSPQAILARMERRLPLLTGGARDHPERQHTLRATITWSYDLLGPNDQQLFRRLSVFEGGCTLEAAEAICDTGGELGASVMDGISSLIAQNLVRRHQSADGEPRFTMLETIHEFAQELLDATDEAGSLRDRHAEFFLSSAEAAEPDLWGREQVPSLRWCEREHDNLRAALEWLVKREDTSGALRLAGALGRFWEMRGHLDEGRRQLDRVLALDSTPTVSRSRALNAAASLAIVHGDTAAARHLAEDALQESRLLGNAHQAAWALANLGIGAYYQAQLSRSMELLQESLALMRQLEDLPGTALALAFLGNVTHVQGDSSQARCFHDESLALRRHVGDQRGIALSLHALATLARAHRDLEEASALLNESLAMCREVDEPMGLAMALSTLGNIALERGEYARAMSLQRESLFVRKVLGDRRGVAWCLVGLAGVVVAQGQGERAARLLGAAQGLRAGAGAPLGAVSRNLAHGTADEARAQVGDATFDAAWQLGQAMTLDEAVAYALAATQLSESNDVNGANEACGHS